MKVERIIVPLDNQPLLGLYGLKGTWRSGRPEGQEEGRRDVFWSCYVDDPDGGYSFRFAYCPMGLPGEFMPAEEGAKERVKIVRVRVERLFPDPPQELMDECESLEEAEKECAYHSDSDDDFLEEFGLPRSELEDRMNAAYKAIEEHYLKMDPFEFYEQRWADQVVEYQKLWDRQRRRRETEGAVGSLNPLVWAFDVEVIPVQKEVSVEAD